MNTTKTICLLSIFFLIQCDSVEEPPRVKKTNFNIIFSPDLSNRIDEKVHENKIITDIDLMANILENYFSEESHNKNIVCNADIFHAKNRITNQRDKIVVRFPNANNVKVYDIDTQKLKIDLADNYFLSKPLNRINYLKEKDSTRSFKKDKQEFINQLEYVYKKAVAKTYGADIYNLLKKRLNPNIIKDPNHPYRNILILFTDGYIESGSYKKFPTKGNRKTYLDKKTVDNFRKAFKKSGEENMEVFFDNNDYGLIPIKNDLLKDLEVLAVEFYDRSKNKGGNETVQPNDHEILKLFWEDWLQKSGVKRFEIYECVDSVEDFEDTWEKFILNKNATTSSITHVSPD